MKTDFAIWMEQVDSAIDAQCGLNSSDLPDYGYWNDWVIGRRPTTVARSAIKAADTF